MLLARGGMSVTLVEQHRFPRNKVCGECLSALGLQVLQRHNLADRLHGIGRPITAAVLCGLTQQVRLPLPSPMLGVSRSAMDAALLAAATDAGAELWQPARVESAEAGGDGVRVKARLLNDNRVVEQRADWVVLADGRGTYNADRPAATSDLGIKAHFTHVSAAIDAVTLYGGHGCYGGVAPIEGGRWNAAFAVPRAMVAAARGDIDAVWDALTLVSSAMRSHFRQAERIGDWLASPLHRHTPPARIDGRLVPVGAAACAIEPIGGEGMGTALRSAELAAAAILAGDATTLPAAYARLWRRRSVFCRLGAIVLGNGLASDAVALAATPVVGRTAMWLVGK